ncbi:MAG: PfkB family carbohydrate kinase [Patescibacteria group bacterium]|jgi:ribokinase
MFKKKYDFVAVGGATRDFMFYDSVGAFCRTPEDLTRQKNLCFEYGAKIEVEKTYLTFGGGAANAAVNFANLGFKAAVLVAAGDDENGLAIINNFKKRGVDTRLIETKSRQLTGFSFILTAGQEKEHVAFLHRGANNQLAAAEKTFKQLKTKWWYVASLSGANWPAILDRVFTAGGSVAWNPGGRQLHAGYGKLKKYLEKTEILALNKDEAIELVLSLPGKDASQINNTKYLLKTLKAVGPKTVLITSGRAGADAFDGKKYCHQRATSDPKKVVDTTGVGDCFDSTFVAALMKYPGDIKKALALAVKNASSLTTKVGAQNGMIKVI